MSRVLIAGDFVPYNRVVSLFETGEYESVLGEVRQITSQVDYAILNLECPVVNNGVTPIEKIGPNLKCSASAVGALKYAGFSGVTLANNHIKDYGDQGIKDTIAILEEAGIDYVGAGLNKYAAERVLYKTVGSDQLAIINCCENEFSIASDNTAGACHLNPVRLFNTIKEAKQQAQYVIVIVHGGHEHWRLPSPRMVETYRFLIDCGTDAVINHHQHCYSGFEIYKSKPIIYGLGNFCFDKGLGDFGDKWHYGYMVVLDFSKSISYRIIPYSQCLDEPSLHLLSVDAFDSELERINKIISDLNELKAYTKDYYDNSDVWANRYLSPVTNRYLKKMQNHGFLGQFVSRKKLLEYRLVLSCESHRDRLVEYIDNKLSK